MPKIHDIPKDEEVKEALNPLANFSWELDQVTNFRDRDIPCLRLKNKSSRAFIYMNKVTGKFCIHGECQTLYNKNKDCVPTTSHDMVIDDGSLNAVALYVEKYSKAGTYEPVGLNQLDAMFTELRDDMKGVEKVCV